MNSELFNKLSNIYRDFGTMDGSLYLLQRVLNNLPGDFGLLKYYLVAQPVPPAPAKPRPHRLVIRQIERYHYQYDWFPRPRKFIDTRFDQNALCFVAFKNDSAIACLWLKAGSYDEDTVHCRFIPSPAPHAVWDFDVYIDPEHRLGRTFTHLWEHAFEWMREHNIRWTMSRIDAFNLASIRSHRRLGAITVNHVLFWNFAGRQITWSTGRPRMIVSQSRVPTINVTAPSLTSVK